MKGRDSMAKDFHNEPFDEETILKLEIFKGYIREWIPVFLSKKSFATTRKECKDQSLF